MLVADSNPFSDLHKIILDMNETRAWVFAEWVSIYINEYTSHLERAGLVLVLQIKCNAVHKLALKPPRAYLSLLIYSSQN